MKKLKIPVTPHITKHLAASKLKRDKFVAVDHQSYVHFQKRIDREYPHLSEAERDALIVTCCLTHPDHRKKHASRKWRWILAAIALVLMVLFASYAAHAQESGLDRINFKDSAGTLVHTYAGPFTIKAGTGMTFSASGNVLTMTPPAGGGGGGYATIQNGGVAIAAEAAINFLGAFACVDNPGLSSDCKLSTNAAVASQYLTGIDASGNFIRKQIAYSELSGSAPVTSVFARTGAVVAASGDYLASQVTNAFDVTAANTLTSVTAPASPAAGKVAVYTDSTNLVLSSKNSSGTVSNTVVPSTCTNQVASAVSAAGVITCHTIVNTDTSGTFAATAHNLLSATHGDTTAASAVRGDGMFAIGATPTWQRLAHPAATGGYFKWNGTDIVASTGAAAGTGTVAVPCSNQFITSVTDNADSAPTTVCATVTRASEGADARGWAFCGTATGATTTVGPVSASTCCSGGLCTQFMVIYQIRGYNGATPVGRLLVANGTISTTALTNSFSVSEGVTAPTTGSGATAIPGLPLATTLSAIGRSGVVFIDGASGQIKTMNVIGNEGTPSVATAPTLFRGASFFSDLGTNLALANFQLTVYDTLTAVAVSAQAFTTGTYLMVLGRKTD